MEDGSMEEDTVHTEYYTEPQAQHVARQQTAAHSEQERFRFSAQQGDAPTQSHNTGMVRRSLTEHWSDADRLPAAETSSFSTPDGSETGAAAAAAEEGATGVEVADERRRADIKEASMRLRLSLKHHRDRRGGAAENIWNGVSAFDLVPQSTEQLVRSMGARLNTRIFASHINTDVRSDPTHVAQMAARIFGKTSGLAAPLLFLKAMQKQSSLQATATFVQGFEALTKFDDNVPSAVWDYIVIEFLTTNQASTRRERCANELRAYMVTDDTDLLSFVDQCKNSGTSYKNLTGSIVANGPGMSPGYARLDPMAVIDPTGCVSFGNEGFDTQWRTVTMCLLHVAVYAKPTGNEYNDIVATIIVPETTDTRFADHPLKQKKGEELGDYLARNAAAAETAQASLALIGELHKWDQFLKGLMFSSIMRGMEEHTANRISASHFALPHDQRLTHTHWNLEYLRRLDVEAPDEAADIPTELRGAMRSTPSKAPTGQSRQERRRNERSKWKEREAGSPVALAAKVPEVVLKPDDPSYPIPRFLATRYKASSPEKWWAIGQKDDVCGNCLGIDHQIGKQRFPVCKHDADKCPWFLISGEERTKTQAARAGLVPAATALPATTTSKAKKNIAIPLPLPKEVTTDSDDESEEDAVVSMTAQLVSRPLPRVGTKTPAKGSPVAMVTTATEREGLLSAPEVDAAEADGMTTAEAAQTAYEGPTLQACGEDRSLHVFAGIRIGEAKRPGPFPGPVPVTGELVLALEKQLAMQGIGWSEEEGADDYHSETLHDIQKEWDEATAAIEPLRDRMVELQKAYDLSVAEDDYDPRHEDMFKKDMEEAGLALQIALSVYDDLARRVRRSEEERDRGRAATHSPDPGHTGDKRGHDDRDPDAEKLTAQASYKLDGDILQRDASLSRREHSAQGHSRSDETNATSGDSMVMGNESESGQGDNPECTSQADAGVSSSPPALEISFSDLTETAAQKLKRDSQAVSTVAGGIFPQYHASTPPVVPMYPTSTPTPHDNRYGLVTTVVQGVTYYRGTPEVEGTLAAREREDAGSLQGLDHDDDHLTPPAPVTPGEPTRDSGTFIPDDKSAQEEQLGREYETMWTQKFSPYDTATPLRFTAWAETSFRTMAMGFSELSGGRQTSAVEDMWIDSMFTKIEALAAEDTDLCEAYPLPKQIWSAVTAIIESLRQRRVEDICGDAPQVHWGPDTTAPPRQASRGNTQQTQVGPKPNGVDQQSCPIHIHKISYCKNRFDSLRDDPAYDSDDDGVGTMSDSDDSDDSATVACDAAANCEPLRRTEEDHRRRPKALGLCQQEQRRSQRDAVRLQRRREWAAYNGEHESFPVPDIPAHFDNDKAVPRKRRSADLKSAARKIDRQRHGYLAQRQWRQITASYTTNRLRYRTWPVEWPALIKVMSGHARSRGAAVAMPALAVTEGRSGDTTSDEDTSGLEWLEYPDPFDPYNVPDNADVNYMVEAFNERQSDYAASLPEDFGEPPEDTSDTSEDMPPRPSRHNHAEALTTSEPTQSWIAGWNEVAHGSTRYPEYAARWGPRTTFTATLGHIVRWLSIYMRLKHPDHYVTTNLVSIDGVQTVGGSHVPTLVEHGMRRTMSTENFHTFHRVKLHSDSDDRNLLARQEQIDMLSGLLGSGRTLGLSTMQMPPPEYPAAVIEQMLQESPGILQVCTNTKTGRTRSSNKHERPPSDTETESEDDGDGNHRGGSQGNSEHDQPREIAHGKSLTKRVALDKAPQRSKDDISDLRLGTAYGMTGPTGVCNKNPAQTHECCRTCEVTLTEQYITVGQIGLAMTMVVIIQLLTIASFLVGRAGNDRAAGCTAAQVALPVRSVATRPIGVIISYTDGGKPLRVLVDTASDVTMMSPTAIDKLMKSTKLRNSVPIQGLGAQEPDTEVLASVVWQHGMKPKSVRCLVVQLPPGIDMLMGVGLQDDLQTVVDRPNSRVRFGKDRVVAPLMTISEATRNLDAKPISVVAACSGASFGYGALRNLGIRVHTWVAIENDKTARQIARTLVPPEALREHENMLSLPAALSREKHDLYIDTCPCQPWSRLNKDCIGFKDTRARPMKASMALYANLKKANPSIKLFAENVTPHHHLAKDAAVMATGWGVKPQLLNAKDCGSASSRPRNIFTDIVDIDALTKIRPAPAQWVLGDEFYCSKPTLECVVASLQTFNPPMKIEASTGKETRLTPDDADAAQGWPPGISDGQLQQPLGLPTETRTKIMGNAINASMMYHVFRSFHAKKRKVVSMPATTTEDDVPDIDQYTNAQQLQDFLATLSDEAMDAWMQRRMGSWELPKMHLKVKAGQQPMPKVKKGYDVPAGLRKSAEHDLAESVASGVLTKVQFREGMCITQAFFQPKNNADGTPRYYEGTDIPMVRRLGDFRFLNSILEDPPAHLRLLCSEIRDIGQGIPLNSKFFKYYDLKDAFHGVEVDEGSKHLLVIYAMGEYYMYNGAAQGVGHSAIFFQPHLHAGFCRILGMHWVEWFVGYVDDYGAHADSETDITIRDRIFKALMKVLKKPFSDKSDSDDPDKPWSTYLPLAGLHITGKGVGLNAEGIDAIKYALMSYPVKSRYDAMHVIGCAQYAHTAFDFDLDHLTLFNDLIAILQDAIAGPQIKWGDAQRTACASLTGLITTRPLLYLDPRTLVDDEHCLVTMTDASDTGIGLNLFRVKRPDARLVTTADLANKDLSQLVDVKYNKLTGSQQRWDTFEAELFAMVRVVEVWGKLITTATTMYPPTPTGPCKIAFRSDSTTAISQFGQLTLPDSIREHLSAKANRFYSWAEKVSHTVYWPMAIMHLPGDQISLPHVMSHMGDAIKQRQVEIRSAGADEQFGYPRRIQVALPTMLHTYHGSYPTTPMGDVPPGFIAEHLFLTQEDGIELQRAYRADHSQIQKVDMAHIYATITGDGIEAVPKLERERATAWKGTSFWAIKPPGIETLLIYTTASAQVQAWGDDSNKFNDTRTLVLVVPDGAKVRVTDLTPVEEHGVITLREDLILMAHDMPDHPGRERTVANLKQLGWWSKMVDDTARHITSCRHCIPRIKAASQVGHSIVAKHRFKVMQIDHKILHKTVQAATGCNAILTMCCMSTRQAMFRPVSSVGAMDAALEMLIMWVPQFGIPEVVRSDNGSAFESAVFKALRGLLGIKSWDFSAADDPTHHSMLESKHHHLQDVLDQATEKAN
jgi:site-specific DNA-cytosine methylase